MVAFKKRIAPVLENNVRLPKNKKNEWIEDAHHQYQTLVKKIPEAKEYIDIHHTVMISYGAVSKGFPGVVTVGHNPAPATNECNLHCVNSGSIELNVAVAEGSADKEQVHAIMKTSADYFKSEKQHPYFKSLELVMNQFGASYYCGIKEDATITTILDEIDS